MARTLADYTDAELEQQFAEAERNALAWSELQIGVHSEHRADRWMTIASEVQAELARRSRLPPPKSARKPRARKPKP